MDKPITQADLDNTISAINAQFKQCNYPLELKGLEVIRLMNGFVLNGDEIYRIKVVKPLQRRNLIGSAGETHGHIYVHTDLKGGRIQSYAVKFNFLSQATFDEKSKLEAVLEEALMNRLCLLGLYEAVNVYRNRITP